jgi:hypothetical protein
MIVKLTNCADDLTDSRLHTEPVRVGWTKSRNPIMENRTMRLPGLLAQLYTTAVEPATAAVEGSRRPKPSSRPPLALEPLSTYEEIRAAAVQWVRSVRLDLRPTPESNIRALVGICRRLDLDTLEALYADVRTWRRWAAVMTGWDRPEFRPQVSCPVCTTFGSLRANADKRYLSAFCNECQEGWDGQEVVILAERIRSAATVAA